MDNEEVPSGTGSSYGHEVRTERSSWIATIPGGYGDGRSRRPSDGVDMLICGVRCPQVGRITMNTSLVDVTLLRGRVALGEEAMRPSSSATPGIACMGARR